MPNPLLFASFEGFSSDDVEDYCIVRSDVCQRVVGCRRDEAM